MAIISRNVFDEGIRALLVVVGTVMIGLTTPKPNNFVTEMALMKNSDMSPMHNVIHKTAVCQACQKLPILEDQVRCDHVKLPAWKSRASQKKNAEIARRMGTVATNAREDFGILIENNAGCLYSKSKLVEMFDIKNVRNVYSEIKHVPDRIFVVCDPNADGSSYTAIASGFWAPNPVNPEFPAVLVVLGIDIINTPESVDRDDAIRSHMVSIKMMMNGVYANVPLIFVPENNSGHASRLEEHVRDLAYVRTLKEPGKDKWGICKTQNLTLDYANTFTSVLYAKTVLWSPRVFTNSEATAARIRGMIQTSDSDVQIIAQEFMLHLSRMKRVQNKNGTLTNKIHGKDGGLNDDGAVAFWMLVYWSKAVNDISNPAYDGLRSLNSFDIGNALHDYAMTHPDVTPRYLQKRYPMSLNVAKYL